MQFVRYARAAAIALLGGLAIGSSALAERDRNYTPEEYCQALLGLGYLIPASCADVEEPLVRQSTLEFEQDYNLPPDGNPDPRTQDMLAKVVRTLRDNLKIVVGSSLSMSQYYDAELEVEVVRFQESFNLPATGIASQIVRERLNREATELMASRPLFEPPSNGRPPASRMSFYRTDEQARQALMGLGYDVPSSGSLTEGRNRSIDEPTRRALADFQFKRGLAASGSFDEETEFVLGETIREIKRDLNQVVVLDNTPLPLTAIYGLRAREVVEEFQIRYGLPVTGVLVEDDRLLLEELAQ